MMLNALDKLLLEAIELGADISVSVHNDDGQALTDKIPLTDAQKAEIKRDLLAQDAE